MDNVLKTLGFGLFAIGLGIFGGVFFTCIVKWAGAQTPHAGWHLLMIYLWVGVGLALLGGIVSNLQWRK